MQTDTNGQIHVANTATPSLLDEIAVLDSAADSSVAAISSFDELESMKTQWRQRFLKAIGGLPARTPLNAKEGPGTRCDEFTIQNVLFESTPGVYVTGHLFLPENPRFRPPYPVVLMANGHTDAAILHPRYAAHITSMVRAGLAVFSWDPVSQGERRQCDARFDSSWRDCAVEHTLIGARSWLVGWNFARFLIWDAMRAIDYLETRSEIDCNRIGICGTSGGGTQSTYVQALDDRISAAFPNCFVSSIRSVFAERGCHDAEQFFFNQLPEGINHAAMLAMGLGRVRLATGSRWEDYFPHSGAVETFAVYNSLFNRLRQSFPDFPAPWHFHCEGPHGLPLATRCAQTDWMVHCLRGAPPPRESEYYRRLLPKGASESDDPARLSPLPFPAEAVFFTDTHHVRDLPGFKSLYDIIAERASELTSKRQPKGREELREIVRRRAVIRPLDRLLAEQPSEEEPFIHPRFGWWYINGPYGMAEENEAAILATIGRSAVGRDAENILIKAAAEVHANGGHPIILKARGWDVIPAAHAYAAEPQLFSATDLAEIPPSWTEMATAPDPSLSSYATGVWGALEEYDWPDLLR